MSKTYTRIDIKSPNDYPKVTGYYFCNRNGFECIQRLIPDNGQKTYMREIRWYLQPIEEGTELHPVDMEQVNADWRKNNLSQCPECGYATANGHVRGCQQATPEVKSAEEIRKLILEKFKHFWVDKKDEYETIDDVEITLGEKSMLKICLDYYAKLKPISIPTEEEINTKFPIKSDTITLTCGYIEANTNKRIGAKWAISQIKID